MADLDGRAAIADRYQAARLAGDTTGMRRLQNEEACFVLLTILANLAAEPKSFIHGVALKGGILMAGELRSPRTSADIDATSGRLRRIDPDRLVSDLRRAGREFDLRVDGEIARTTGGTIVRLRFDSLTDAGSAKLEVSIREDPVFALRDAVFNVAELGITPFTLPALAEVELVAEKLRALVQRAQPRDLFDIHLYLTQSGWHFDLAELRTAVDAKISITRHKHWRAGLWRTNLEEIRGQYDETMSSWIDPSRLVPIDELIDAVAVRLKALKLD